MRSSCTASGAAWINAWVKTFPESAGAALAAPAGSWSCQLAERLDSMTQ
jgi:hypothetical protein